jgi:NAD(P)H dehydrogenase (quinone)
MKILILYFSKTGNTRAIAQAVARGVERVEPVEAVLRNTREITKEDFLAADGVVVGSPVYYGSMASELKKIFENFDATRAQMEDKIGAVFTTSENPTGGKYNEPRKSDRMSRRFIEYPYPEKGKGGRIQICARATTRPSR